MKHKKYDFIDLPSECDDFNASVWAANAFVRSNNISWNCFVSAVTSTDRSELVERKQKKNSCK